MRWTEFILYKLLNFELLAIGLYEMYVQVLMNAIKRT